MKTKTKVKAGALTHNHNKAQVRDAAPGLKVQTNVKAEAPRRRGLGHPDRLPPRRRQQPQRVAGARRGSGPQGRDEREGRGLDTPIKPSLKSNQTPRP